MPVDVNLASFSPLDPEVRRCPYPHYASLRATAPVHYAEALGMYLITSHELVKQVVRDPATFSSDREKFALLSPTDRALLESVAVEGYPRITTLLRTDPPTHTRYRRLVSKAFNPKAINALVDVTRSITVELIDSWLDAGTIEFVGQFAIPLPLRVIATALNVPDERLTDFKRWSDNMVVATGANPSLEVAMDAERGVNESQHYFAAKLEQRRNAPQDDLLTNLLNARIDDDDPEVSDKRPLDLPEILNLIQQILTGGNETTTNLLTEMMVIFAAHPEHWSAMQRDPSVIASIVEESLRYASVAQGMLRLTTRDVELGGTFIPEGSTVVAMYVSANHDESVFGHSDDFDPSRANLGDHIAFGQGPHYCLGANLARMEARVALEELTRRIAHYSLSSTNEYNYNPSFILRGLHDLTIEITPA